MDHGPTRAGQPGPPVFDLSMRAIYASPSVYQLRGYTPEECLRQTAAERLTPRSQEVVRQAFAEGLALEQAGGQLVLRRAAGAADHPR